MRRRHVETRCNHSIAEVLHVCIFRKNISLFGIKFTRLLDGLLRLGCVPDHLFSGAARCVRRLCPRALLGRWRPLGDDRRCAVGRVVCREATDEARHHILDVPGGLGRSDRDGVLEPRHHRLLEGLLGRPGLLEGEVGQEFLVLIDLVGRKPVRWRDPPDVPGPGRLAHP